MISRLSKLLVSSQRSAFLLPKRLDNKTVKGFFDFMKNCYQKLNIKEDANKDEINSAFQAQLRIIQSRPKSSQQEKEIQQLREAQEQAINNLNKNHGGQNESQSNDSTTSKASPEDGFQQSGPREGFFKQFLRMSNFGKTASKEEKTWGMELFVFGIIGVTGICYVIGTNLTDKSQQNITMGPNIILTQKDLELSKQYYSEYQKMKKEQYELMKQQQQQTQDQQKDIQNQFQGKDDSNKPSAKSQFDKDFEEYKKKYGWSGKDE